MTSDEIKANVSMRDVLAKYGVSVNRNNMCCCPLHGERHPSMKVFKDGYKCFACNSNGDIFTFVQEMEGCGFKEAFFILGGDYEQKSNNARIAANVDFDRQKKIRQKAEQDQKRFHKWLMGAIDLCCWWIDNREPFSDDWCYAQNKLPWLWHVYETKYMEGEEVEEFYVYRKCEEIRQRFITV